MSWRWKNASKQSNKKSEQINSKRTCMHSHLIQCMIRANHKFCFVADFFNPLLDTSMLSSHHNSTVICLTPEICLYLVHHFLKSWLQYFLQFHICFNNLRMIPQSSHYLLQLKTWLTWTLWDMSRVLSERIAKYLTFLWLIISFHSLYTKVSK